MARYILHSKQQITPSTVLITLEPKNGAGFSFNPGQYASLRFRRRGRPTPARCFSFVNYPTASGILQFAVRVQGKYTTAVSELSVGQQVVVDGPFGDFGFDPEYDRISVMLAGGIGITPILGILRYVTQLKLPNQIVLLYSCRNEQDMAFAEELLTLERRNPQLRVVFVISSGVVSHFDAGHVVKGRITSKLVEQACRNNFLTTSFFVCGSDGFMEAMTSILQQQETPVDRIFTETFASQQVVTQGSNWGTKLFSVYGLTAITMLVATAGIAGMDIIRNVHTVSAAPVTQSSSSGAATNSSNAAAAQTQTYSPPVSSVS